MRAPDPTDTEVNINVNFFSYVCVYIHTYTHTHVTALSNEKAQETQHRKSGALTCPNLTAKYRFSHSPTKINNKSII